MARSRFQHRMMRVAIRMLLACIGAGALVVANESPAAAACTLERCPTPGLEGGDATIEFSGAGVGAIVAGNPEEAVDYIWRLRDLCVGNRCRLCGCNRPKARFERGRVEAGASQALDERFVGRLDCLDASLHLFSGTTPVEGVG